MLICVLHKYLYQFKILETENLKQNKAPKKTHKKMLARPIVYNSWLKFFKAFFHESMSLNENLTILSL